MTEQPVLSKYQEMIRGYLEGEISAPEFSLNYLQEFKGETMTMSDNTYDILQDLFRKADAYCEDPELREKTSDGIGEAELRKAAIDASNKLDRRLEEIE
ncbi:colicin immunity domain-containing protein [Natrinema sp. 1APR25-10V2]|uniref:colicin immunity domain-containing protein n=1 Tax=Natrinema sp. 1APR25-10V2 TaxID=2951081 RepID=UPI002875248C|nr:colicin immunity domain-containing protein [Natrinema sp. 1APR25-10V2]MDS0474449.1 colicin immunity domain-containing protein [Natrinema sp. 1APR25-10V2]